MTRLTVLLASMATVILLAPGNNRIDLFLLRWALSLLNAFLAGSLYFSARRAYNRYLDRHAQP